MLRKFVASAFTANALIAPMAAGAVALSAAPALAQEPPVVCYVFEFICDRKTLECVATEPQLDPDCDGVAG